MSARAGVQEVIEKKGSFDLKEFLRRYNIAIVFVILVIFSILVTKGLFFSFKNLLNLGERASIVGIVAIGQMLIMITGGIDLSTGGVMAMSFTSFAILTGRGMPIFIAILCALLIGAAAGALSGIFVVKTKIPPFLVTLSVMMIMNSLALYISQQKQLRYSNLQDWINNFLGDSLIMQALFPTIIWLIISAIILFVLSSTRVGMNLYAVGGQPKAAFLSGVRATETKFFAYVMGGVFSAIAGLMFAYRVGSLNPIAAETFQLESVAAAVLGGTSVMGGEGTVYGSFMGAIMIALLMNVMNLLQINPFFQYSIMGIIIISIVILQNVLRETNK